MELDACQAKKRPVKKILLQPNREGRRRDQTNCKQIEVYVNHRIILAFLTNRQF